MNKEMTVLEKLDQLIGYTKALVEDRQRLDWIIDNCNIQFIDHTKYPTNRISLIGRVGIDAVRKPQEGAAT